MDREKAAVRILNAVRPTHVREERVELVFFRNHLLDVTISEAINLFGLRGKGRAQAHRHYARPTSRRPCWRWTWLLPSIDIGRLTHEYLTAQPKPSSVATLFGL
ncbi:MAG: hypothetical protein R2810_04095 [Flavobacteriales bacterium]